MNVLRYCTSATGSNIGSRWRLLWLTCIGLPGVMAMLGGCARQAPPSETVPLFDTTRHDLGAVRLESEYPATYRLTNSTTKPITVRNIKASCGCIATNFDPSPIPAGGTRDITLTLNTKGVTTLGPLVKHATVHFDQHAHVELELLARLEPEFELQPRSLNFTADQPEQKLILLRKQLDPASFAALFPLASGDHYEVSEVEAARSVDRREFLIRLLGAPAGATLPAITMTDSLSNAVLPFSTVLCSRSGPTIRPSAFVVVVTDTSARPPAQHFKLIDPDSRPLRIVEITSDQGPANELLQVTFAPEQDARSFKVSLKAVPTERITRQKLVVTFESDSGPRGQLLLPCHVLVPAADQP